MTFRCILPAAALAALLAAPAAAQRELTVETTELRGGIVMVNSGIAGNLAVLPGPDGVLVIDNHLPDTGPATEAAIADIAGTGVPRFILNTHWHGDHTGGNHHFAHQGTAITAHHNVRERLLAAAAEWTEADGALPIITFGHDLTFHMNGQTVTATHIPNAHTDGDVIVHFPEADVIHMGDLFFSGLFPYIDLDSGGSVAGYIAAQRRGLAMAGPDTWIIPGHGPLSTRAELAAAADMLEQAQRRVTALVDQGLSLEEVMDENPLADLGETWSWRFITTERMTAILYRDAAGG